jgi:hypothetical protein
MSNEIQNGERSWYITYTITYRTRWKINQMKLLLQDMDTLVEKYGIGLELQKIILEDCELYLAKLAEVLKAEKERKRKLLEKVKNVAV